MNDISIDMIPDSLDIVIIARDTWSHLWRRRQYLADRFARDHKVLFVEPPFSLPRFAARSPETTSRPKNRLMDIFRPPRRVQKNLYVAAPLKPVPNHPAPLRAVNRAVEAYQLRRTMNALEMKCPILWINPEYAVWLADALPNSLVVYDVTDDWTQASLSGRELDEIRANDKLLLARADIVFTVSPGLHAMKSPHNPNTIFMPNGVDPELYDISPPPRPRELEGLSGPIVGYTGSLHEDRIDVELIAYLAERGKFSQVFVGPNYLQPETTDRLASMRNVLLIPPQHHRALPAFVHHFDVCSIPHEVTPFTNSLDPIKAYEYLATGKPIVSSPVDGIKPLADLIEISAGYRDYLDKITLALAGRHKSTVEQRKLAARNNSWESRAADIIKYIHTALEKKQS